MKNAVKSGAILALIGILISVTIYIVDATLLINMWYGITMLLVSLGIVIYFGMTYRKNELDNVMPFKDAFLHGLVILLISNGISTCYNILLYFVIDPELPEILMEATIQQTYEMMQGFGLPSNAVDEAMEEAKKSAANSFTIGGILKGYGFACIGAVIIALITGAIVKRKAPEFE